MADTPMDERRFSDREVREILKKAVEKAPSRALTNREGLSLAELKAIGEEVGIDPARVEDAARAVAGVGERRSSSLLGGPTILNFQRRVKGGFGEEDTPEVLSVIRRTTGLQGETDEIHGSLEWKAEGDAGGRYVTLTPRDGHTTITASANLTNTAILTYLPAGTIGLITAVVGFIKFAQDGSQMGLIVGLAILPVLYGILRTIMSRVSRSEANKLQRVVEELALLAEEPGE
jgi:hypothetical protein